MRITKDFIIPATVVETGEKVMVDNVGADMDNPWGFYSEMWHNTADGRVFHDDELIFEEDKE